MKKRKGSNQAGASLAPDKYAGDDLRTLIAALQNTPNIWSQRPVESEPVKHIAAWSVYKATPSDDERSSSFGLHFIGRDLSDMSGCVSSKIVSFDPKTMRGATRSGRVYQLTSLPAYCPDAEYVLDNWARFNQVEVEDATDEFVKASDLSLEQMERILYAPKPGSGEKSDRAGGLRKIAQPTAAPKPKPPQKAMGARKPRRPKN